MVDPDRAGSSQRPPGACPLCRHETTRVFLEVAGRLYHRCGRCEMTFLDRAQLPSPLEERAHYDTHENRVDDEGYRAFLARLADPLLARLSPAARGLDYGCGPGPALIAIMEEAGHAMAGYDPFYRPDAATLAATYDFITCTEVAEHFHHPGKEFARMAGMVRPGGILAVMTSFQTDDDRFARWHYRADPTHVSFYREETFRVLAGDLHWSVEIPRKDVALLTRPATAN